VFWVVFFLVPISSNVRSLLVLELGMARDRNVTVWQAYVIVMSIVSVLSLGWLFFILFTSGTNQRTAETALRDKRSAEENLRAASNKNQLLMSMLGVGNPISDAEFEQLRSQVTGDADIDAAAKAYTDHMVLFGPGATEKSYLKLVDNLMQQLRRRNEALIKIQNDSDTDRKNFSETIKRETDLRLAAQKEKEEVTLKAQADLEGYTDKINKQIKLYEELQAEKVAQQQKMEARIAELRQQLESVERDRDTFKVSLANVNRKLALVREVGFGRLPEEVLDVTPRESSPQSRYITQFERVQGEVRDVMDGNVWINRGFADRLTKGVTFNVFDADTNKVASAKKKATIEVVEIISDHVARARIIEDRAYEPILRGDKIYSLFWQPGMVTEYALVGKMDMSGNGRDDRQRLKSLIERNNAKVVFDLPDGQPLGRRELPATVRFLVVGGDVALRSGADGEVADAATMQALRDRQQIVTKARDMGIEIIPLGRLVAQMLAEESSRSLGSDYRPSVTEYSKPSTNQYHNGKVSELYQTPSGKLNPSLRNP
jgi:hypothetical protein